MKYYQKRYLKADMIWSLVTKMAVLSDAFLLANAFTCLAEREDTEVQMISKVIGI